MSAIKNFFKKRKQDLHFTMAGPGRRLCDQSSGSSVASRAEASPQTSREAPTMSAQRAGEAALSRLVDQNRPRTSRTKNSDAAEEVRKELETERQEMKEAARLAEVYGEKKEKELEASPLLKVDNVRFTCELLGDECGTFQEIESRIATFLLSSLASEPLQAGSLCIMTLEKCVERRQACVSTLEKLLENLQSDSNNPKFRRVRLKNKAIEQRIVAVKGAVEFLEGVGFERHEEAIPDASSGEEGLEPVLLLAPGKCLSTDHLTECQEALQNAEPIRPALFRNTAVFCATGWRPQQLSRVELPPEFYRISPEELKKEQEVRRQAVEQMGMLRTKAMREREAQRELRRYRFCLLRVRFPDNTVLQGVFFAHDKAPVVVAWVRDCLTLNFVPFRLTTPSGQKLETGLEVGEAASLAELGLAPAAVLSFDFEADVLHDVLMGQGQAGATVQYLAAELLATAKPL